MEWKNIGALKNHNFNPFCWENALARATEYKITFENEWGYKETNGGWKTNDVVKGWIESKGHNAALKTNEHQYGAVARNHYTDELDNYGAPRNYWYYDALQIY